MPSENGRRQFIIFAFRRHIKRRLYAVCRRFACVLPMPEANAGCIWQTVRGVAMPSEAI
ncbi:hypothetical protein [Neisseria meningitidis]|uniref:hypothetical protein n=1 Tax=Neisseria meningitidis TaxID=487 RepID=UPI0013E08810|nr:hypothetical protein [Neisseria meningitidis]